MKKPADTEADIFQQALDGVTPLKPTGRIARATPPRHPPARPEPAPSAISDALTDPGAGDTALSEYLRNGVSRMTLRKLRRGQWPPEDSLDLHGLNSDAARRLLLQFLNEATRRGLRCVAVVHGKGWHTEGGEGILKVRTRHWLAQCAEVLAFCEAPLHAGGGGAVWVLLRNAS